MRAWSRALARGVCRGSGACKLVADSSDGLRRHGPRMELAKAESGAFSASESECNDARSCHWMSPVSFTRDVMQRSGWRGRGS